MLVCLFIYLFVQCAIPGQIANGGMVVNPLTGIPIMGWTTMPHQCFDIHIHLHLYLYLNLYLNLYLYLSIHLYIYMIMYLFFHSISKSLSLS